jgi:hypothetical protein
MPCLKTGEQELVVLALLEADYLPLSLYGERKMSAHLLSQGKFHQLRVVW